MRKYFVHFSTGHENIRAIIEAGSCKAALTHIRKLHKSVTIFSIQDIAQMESASLAMSLAESGEAE